MDSPLLSRLSDWNPQLFRELKGRLKPRNLIVAIALAVLLQLLLLGFFASMLPTEADDYSHYCTTYTSYHSCLVDADGNLFIAWKRWWLNIFQTMNWLLLLGAMLSGSYLLIQDIYQEEKRGTLNFIRLSPQSSSSILLGKMLGVPSLVYLAIALALPLHLFAAQSADVSLVWVLSLYVIGGAGCWFLYSLALLGGFLGKAQARGGNQIEGGIALLAILTVLILFIPGYIWWNIKTSWASAEDLLSFYLTDYWLTWFMLPLQQNTALAHALTLTTVGIASGWIWSILVRRLHSPGSTLITKRQSYGLVLCVQTLILGFWWNRDNFVAYYPSYSLRYLCFYMVPVYIGLIFLLSNQRQVLLDWARFRHINMPTQRRYRLGDWRSLLYDLLWSEKSPAIVAIAANLMIAAVFVIVWIMAWPVPDNIWWTEVSRVRAEMTLHKLQAIAALVLTLNMIVLYGSIVQLMMLMKASNRTSWTAATLFSVIGFPLLVTAILVSEGKEILGTALLLFSPFPVAAVSLSEGAITLSTMGLACLAQWGGILLLNLRFINQMKRLGESTSKSLLTEAKS